MNLPPVVDDRRWARLRWRCRRGLLENDIVLERWLERTDRTVLTEDDVAALDQLLDLDDNSLWDLLSGRADSHDGEMQRLVRQLRSV